MYRVHFHGEKFLNWVGFSLNCLILAKGKISNINYDI